MGEYQAGLQRAEKALALDPPEDVKVTAYQLLGNLCWCVGRYQEAIRHHERSLEIELRRDNSYGLAACYNNLALVSQDLGQIERALDLYHHSLDQWDKYGDPRGRARCMANLGILYMERGDYRRSAEYQQEALATFERLGDLNGIGWVRECLGEVCGALGKWVASEAYYRGSLEICERSGNIPLSIYAYLNLGETYHTFCATESALECAEEGGARAAKIGNDFLICAANLLRGQIKIRLGCMSEAAQLLEQARCRLGELGNRPEAVKAMTQIARLHHANADYGEALEVAQASLTEACEFGQRELMADLHHLMGQIHHEEGRLGLAREELDRASEIASELGRQEMLWAIHHDSGRLHCVTGDLNRARDELLAAVEVGKLTWEALPEALQKTYLEDSRHQLLKGDISHLKNCMLGRSEHVR